MTFLIGGALIIAALVVGHFEGYLMGVKVRNVAALSEFTELDPRPCLCGHAHSSHRGKRAARACRVETSFEHVCACTVYIPEPTARIRGELEL